MLFLRFLQFCGFADRRLKFSKVDVLGVIHFVFEPFTPQGEALDFEFLQAVGHCIKGGDYETLFQPLLHTSVWFSSHLSNV